MGMQNWGFTVNHKEAASVRLTLFFQNLISALEKHRQDRVAQIASESCKLCRDVLFKVLIKSLPKGTDTSAAKELVASFGDKVGGIPKTKGQPKNKTFSGVLLRVQFMYQTIYLKLELHHTSDVYNLCFWMNVCFSPCVTLHLYVFIPYAC